MAVTDAAGASDRTPDGREVAGLGPSASPDVSALLPAGAHSVPQARHPGGPSPQHPPPPAVRKEKKNQTGHEADGRPGAAGLRGRNSVAWT